LDNKVFDVYVPCLFNENINGTVSGFGGLGVSALAFGT
jgi:hypothetical protein